MAAINFQPRFAPAIEAGTKIHTLRLKGYGDAIVTDMFVEVIKAAMAEIDADMTATTQTGGE